MIVIVGRSLVELFHRAALSCAVLFGKEPCIAKGNEKLCFKDFFLLNSAGNIKIASVKAKAQSVHEPIINPTSYSALQLLKMVANRT